MTTQDLPAWPPLFSTLSFKLKPNTGLFTSPLSGSMQVSSRSGDQWQCDVTFPPMSRADYDAWSAWAARQASRAEASYVGEYRRPQNYLSGIDGALTCDSTTVKCDSTTFKADTAYTFGNPRVSGGSQVGRSLVTVGWNANAPLYAGMWIAFENGVFRELHKLESSVTASASGGATLSLTPPIRRSPASLTQILVDGKTTKINRRCVGEFLIVPGEMVGWDSDAVIDRLENIKFVEYLR